MENDGKGGPALRIKISAADKWFSLYIRYRDKWTCQRCLKRYPKNAVGLHNSHFWGRGTKATRWDEENCKALCYGCHQRLGSNPQEYHEFMIKRLGEQKLEALMFRAKNVTRFTGDEKMIALAYRDLVKRMECEWVGYYD